ncbi:Beta-galactosidase/beta-glucuronidase [Halorientalis persicus]|uniref:Beta-galactosidase/beta-glucuronidase n=1 Tax=Halorientalis persicus TaxID=1367881 RepID=A0A1H8ERI6_9EURY|nr:hydrolase [Halorientalis persicus]SEN21744.1 Beta-galactosidase/beta-glucuronidase [Halorientalis persicus]
MLGEWTGTSVEPGAGKPEPDVWTPVEIPGRPQVFADADAAAYRSVFDDPRSGDEDRAVIELRGLFAHARIWLNGDLVGEHDAYFRPFRHSFEPEDQNELIVECRPPEDRFGGVHDTNLVPESDRIPGIWWDASVETHPGTFVYELDVHPRLVDGNAEIDVRAVVETDTDLDDRVTFSLRPEGEFQSRGMMDRAAVEADAGERAVVEHTIDVRDPSLWWPRELGPQHQYAVRAKIGDATRSVVTGLCSVDRDADGLVVNGERVPGRGVTLLSATPGDIDRAVEANATVVRMHAHAPDPAVYEACNEAGLLVWQDLPLTGPGTFDADRGQELAAALDRTYGRHPSLFAYSVHDDPLDLVSDPLGSGTLDRLRLRWRAWRASYDRGPAESVAAGFPADRLVLPVVGALGSGADAPTLYPGWDYGDADDVGWVLDTFEVGGVVGEFGAGAFGAVMPDDDPAFDRAKHDAHVDGGTDASQAYQARVVKRIAEELRRRDTSLFAAHTLRDATPAGMGVVERDGDPKTGYRALRAAYEPVQATLAAPGPGETTPLTVVNDERERISGTVEWSAGDEGGEVEVSVDAGDTATPDTIPIPADAASVTLSLSLPDRVVENTYRFDG